MDDDVKRRAETAIKALHERALVVAHPDQDHDMGQVLQALALTWKYSAISLASRNE
jgi:hypothetical protein